MTVNARMKIASTNMDIFCTGITVSNGKKLSEMIAINEVSVIFKNIKKSKF